MRAQTGIRYAPIIADIVSHGELIGKQDITHNIAWPVNGHTGQDILDFFDRRGEVPPTITKR